VRFVTAHKILRLLASVLGALNFMIWLTIPATGQSNAGELRLKVADPTGLGVKSSVAVTSEANQYRRSFVTDDFGILEVNHLPLGIYELSLNHPGFAPFSGSVEIRSAIPVEYLIKLSVAEVSTAVLVKEQETLIDPHSSGTIEEVGSQMIEDRVSSLPGRSLADLVNSQPGWLYEGNAVLHPRGSEYQTQFVIDGIPLTDNRSPSAGPEIEAEDVQAMSVYTADIPAEYGRKMGGVVEITTEKNTPPGWHGKAILAGGSFGTVNAYDSTEYGWGKNVLGLSADGAATSRFLNPPILQAFTDNGTTADFSARFDRALGNEDRLTVSVRHELSHFAIPNELIQQQAGQRQDRSISETMSTFSYQHIFSSNVLGDLRGMLREDNQKLWSNELATPIIAAQDRSFHEGYVKGSTSVHQGRNEWKIGVEADFTHLSETFSDAITDFTRFDPGTPAAFQFFGRRWDLEQGVFVQDQARLGAWTITAGMRWDHYGLLVNESALSPRIGVARYFSSAGLIVRASYDRIFQTPAFENILLASSPDVAVLNPNVLRLPVKPSLGNYYQVGLTKGFFGKFRLDANYFLRHVNNFADDDPLLNTSVSFPVALDHGDIYGAEAKLNFPRAGRLSGYVAYSYLVSSVYLPAKGGLFLGVDATSALDQMGRLWSSQDQRHAIRTRFQYQLTPRLWLAAGGQYGSGLPVAFDGTEQQALAQYSAAIVDRVNFDRGRVRPNFSVDASAGVIVWNRNDLSVRIEADVQNITDHVNVIDFAGLFSGNAVTPPRAAFARVQTSF
jgi:outer membrane cobalamin receptor